MRNGGVLSLLLILFSICAVAGMAEPYVLAPCDRQVLLSQARQRDYEKAVPLHPRSLAARYPELYRRVMTLSLQYASWEVAFPSGIVKGASYAEATERVVDVHRTISEILRDQIATLTDADKDAEFFLEYSARLFDVDPPPENARWVRRLHYAHVERVRRVVKDKKILGLAESNYHGELFHALASHIHTSWGEVRAAFLVPDLQGSNLIGEDIDEFTTQFPRFELGDSRKDLRQANVDVLWKTNGGLTTLHFGEVKTYTRALHVGDYWLWEPLLDQLAKLEILARRSHSLHQVWVMLINGVTEEAKRELTSLGYEVVGPVVSAPVAHH